MKDTVNTNNSDIINRLLKIRKKMRAKATRYGKGCIDYGFYSGTCKGLGLGFEESADIIDKLINDLTKEFTNCDGTTV